MTGLDGFPPALRGGGQKWGGGSGGPTGRSFDCRYLSQGFAALYPRLFSASPSGAGYGDRGTLRAADSIAGICPRVSLRFTLGYSRQAPPGRVMGFGAALWAADSSAGICPRVSLRFTLGYSPPAPPGRVEEIRCGVGEVRAFPRLRIETLGTHFSCGSRLGAAVISARWAGF